jgi:hypothetical protein
MSGPPESSPLYTCDVTGWCDCDQIAGRHRHVEYSMAFDPIYGPESDAQIDWHRGEHGEAFVDGWEVGEAIPGKWGRGSPDYRYWRRSHGQDGGTAFRIAQYELWLRGMSVPQIACETGVSERRVRELLADVEQVDEKPKSTALECGDSRNESREVTRSTSPLISRNGGPPERRVCAADGCDRRVTVRRADARYCSPACRQRAYRERQATLFEDGARA